MKKAYLYIFLATVLFSTMEIALKLVSGQFNPIQLTFERFLIGSIVLIPLALRNLKKRKLRLKLDDYKFFLVTGFICVVVSMTFYQLAVLHGKASVVAVLFSCNPVFVIPLAYLMVNEKIYKNTVVSMTLSILGIIFITNPFGTSSNFKAIIFVILSAATFALYGVIGKTKSERYGGVILTCFSFIFGSIEMFVLIMLAKIDFIGSFLTKLGLQVFCNVSFTQGFIYQNMPGLIYIGVFVTGLGYTFYFLAMEEASAAVGSLVFYIKPALAPALAMIILQEHVTFSMLTGIGFIIIGSAVTFIFSIRRTEEID